MGQSQSEGLNVFTQGWNKLRADLADLPADEALELLCENGDKMAAAMDRLQRERDDYRGMLKGTATNITNMLETMTAFDGDALGEKG